MRRFESTGGFREFHLNNIFRSIMTQLLAFCGLLIIVINNKKITHGNSDDAFKTMKLVYKIYYQDVSWRKKYHIADPNIS